MAILTDALRAAIKVSDETQYSIAKGAGVARSQLSRLMSGKQGMSEETIERLAEYLGLEIIIQPKPKTRKGK